MDAPLLPKGCSLPLLSDAEAIKHAQQAGNRLNDQLNLQQTPGGPLVFALFIVDDAMSPRMTAGDIIVVDPEQSMPHGAIVAVVVKGADASLGRPILIVRLIPKQIACTRRNSARYRAVSARLAKHDDREERARDSTRHHFDDRQTRLSGGMSPCKS